MFFSVLYESNSGTDGTYQLISADAATEEDEDVHICGACKLQFRSIESFIQHKKQHKK